MTEKEAKARASATLAVARAKKERAAQKKEAEITPGGVLDATASLASGAIAGPVSGFAGLAGSVLPGPEGQGADWVNKTQQALTYQPRTQGGQRIVETVSAPFEYIAEKADQAGGAVTDLTGSPALGSATNAGLQTAPSIAGLAAKVPLRRSIANARVEGAAAATRNSVKDATFNAARAEGYGVPRSIHNPSFVSNQIESIGGKAAVKQDHSLRNQQVTNRIARREAGLNADDPISEASLAAVRDRLSQPYREVAAVSPRARTALERLQEVRFEARQQWTFYRRQGNPEAYRTARALDQRAAVYERLIDAEARRARRPGLVDRLRDARVRLAKNHVVERALNESDGNVDAQIIGKMRARDPGLTDGLRTIGEFARAFPDVARPEARVQAPGVSKLDYALSLGAGVGGASVFGIPGAVAGLAPIVASPLARALARRGQGPRTYGPGAGLQTAHGLAGVIPLIGASGMPKRQ